MNSKKLLTRTFITLTILFILFTIFIPLSSAAPMDDFIKCEAIVTVLIDEESKNEPIMPYSSPQNVSIIIQCQIRGILQDIVSEIYGEKEGEKIYIFPTIHKTPTWCTASINPPLLKVPVSEEVQSTNATVTLTLDRNSPAFEKGEIEINIFTRKLGNTAVVIPSSNKTFIIPFTVGYIPIIAINHLEGNYKAITPDDTVKFPIELINMGNGKTVINTDVLSIPDGWTVDIIPLATLDARYLGEKYKTTLNLAVKPPIDFGYHEEREVIQISVTPSSYVNPSLIGEEHILTFVVHSKGFTTPGFEGIILIFSIIILLFIFKKNKKSKNNFEEGNR